MANISVRKLDENTLRKLQERAKAHGVSMEEEIRQILREAVSAPARLGDLAVQTFGKRHGIDLVIPARRPHEPIDFEK